MNTGLVQFRSNGDPTIAVFAETFRSNYLGLVGRLPCAVDGPMRDPAGFAPKNQSKVPMSQEKPDLLRQSEGFERVHASLTISLIATCRDGDNDRPGIRVCSVDDSVVQVRADNVNPAFDYLPVEESSRDIVGLFPAKSYANAAESDEGALVGDCMHPLSEADLIGAGASIFDFICRVRPRPLLVVSGGRIEGLVAWSDLQKLPVRAAVFALVTGFELTMYEAIKAVFPSGDGWQEYLTDDRLRKAEEEFKNRRGNDSDVELLLCTGFCDKRTILKKRLPFDSQGKKSAAMPISKGRFESDVEKIEELRNSLAHANSYAMNWDEVKDLRDTVKILVKLRKHIKRLSVMTRPLG